MIDLSPAHNTLCNTNGSVSSRLRKDIVHVMVLFVAASDNAIHVVCCVPSTKTRYKRNVFCPLKNNCRRKGFVYPDQKTVMVFWSPAQHTF